MITDSLMCKGFPVGTKFDFGGQEVVIYPDGSAHLVEAGNLAGSTLNVNKGLKILIEDALVPVNYAINACTSNPARCLHAELAFACNEQELGVKEQLALVMMLILLF